VAAAIAALVISSVGLLWTATSRVISWCVVRRTDDVP
jgi:hypothetical protein